MQWVGKRFFCAFFVFYFLFLSQGYSKVVYVKPAGSDGKNGLSWSTAKKTVSAGMGLAVSGDEVWVAGGTYYERIALKADVDLCGGFAGNETDFTQRDFEVNVTILDGEQGGSVVRSPKGLDSFARIDGFTIQNGYAISGGGGIYCNSSSPVINNNTIINNGAYWDGGGIFCDNNSSPAILNSTITGNDASYGGGIQCHDNSSPTIASCTINGNIASYGGSIFCDNSTPSIAYCTISQNTSSMQGGGILCYSASPIIDNNVISQNTSIDGGGIHCREYSSPSITNNTISGNTATYDGGGIYCRRSSPAITNNTITENTAGYGSSGIYCSRASAPAIQNNTIEYNYGRGIYCFDSSNPTINNNAINGNIGGGIYCGYYASPAITNNAIMRNSAAYGAGISSSDSWPRIDNNTIERNNATDDGGGIYCSECSPPISNNIINGNSAPYGGGICLQEHKGIITNNRISGNVAYSGAGIYYDMFSRPTIRNNVINENYASIGGGGISCSFYSIIANNTITGNSAADGGGIQCGSSCVSTIANNIIAFNSSGIYRPSNPYALKPFLYNNCIFNPDGYDYANLEEGVCDFTLDPRFIDLGNEDFHIVKGSPCVDSGSDASIEPGWFDMDNETRVIGSHVDIGADEVTNPPFPVVGKVILGDYDPADPSVPVAVKIQVRDLSDNVVRTQKEILDEGGNFTIHGLVSGNYTIFIKACSWLQKLTNITKSEATYDMGNLLLVNGDLHGDNECGSTSLSIVLDKLGTMGETPPEPFPTPYPTPGAAFFSITGTIALGDYDPVDKDVPVAVKVELSQDGWPLRTQNIILDSYDNGSINIPDVPAGSYDVAIKACTWLQNVIHVELDTYYDFGQVVLVNGDLHGDNECGSTSLSVVLDKLGGMGD